MDDILGAPPSARPSNNPAQVSRAPIPYARVIRTTLIWGWGAAAVLGLVFGGLLHALLDDAGSYVSLKSGLNFGAMVGFLIGSVWAVSSVLELEIAMAPVVGALLGAADTTIHYFGESILMTPPDYAFQWYSLIGAGAGAVAGAFSAIWRDYRENS